MHRKKSSAVGIQYLEDEEDTEIEYTGTNKATPVASNIRHQSTPDTRSSERIKRRQSQKFVMPSRHAILDKIPASLTPSKSLKDYRRPARVNDFTKEKNRYNADKGSISDVSSDSNDDFINDDQEVEQEQEESSSSDDDEATAQPVIESSDSESSSRAPSAVPSPQMTTLFRSQRDRGDRRSKRIITRGAESSSESESLSRHSGTQGTQQTPLNGAHDGPPCRKNQRVKRLLFSSNEESDEDDDKRIDVDTSEEEEGAKISENTARLRRNSAVNRSIVSDDGEEDVNNHNCTTGDDRIIEAPANQSVFISPISPKVASTADTILLPTENTANNNNNVISAVIPALTVESSDNSGGSSESQTSSSYLSSSDGSDLELTERPAKRAKHMLRKKQPKLEALDRLKQVRGKKVHAISEVVVDDI